MAWRVSFAPRHPDYGLHQAGASAISFWLPYKHATASQGNPASTPSWDSNDASSSSPAVGQAPAAQSLGSSVAPAPAKQLIPGPSLDVINEDEEHGHRHLSPGHSLHSVEVCKLRL